MTTSVEYNRIHALARARKVVMDKFGPDLLHFWPMVDDTPFIRDLLRRKVLVGQGGVTAQAAGMLDYGMDIGAGHISDEVADQGQDSFTALQPTKVSSDYYLAVPVPEGRWKSVKFRNEGGSALSPGVILAAPSVSPTDLSAAKVLDVNSVIDGGPYFIFEHGNPNESNGHTAGGTWPRAGQKITLNGDLVQVGFRLRRETGAPTGTGYVKVYKVSDGSLLGTASTTLDVSTLTASFVWKDFFFNTPLNIPNIEVRVVFEYNSGDVNNYLLLNRGNADDISGMLCGYNGSSWNDTSGDDAVCKVRTLAPLHRCDFPFELDAVAGQYWLYFRGNSDYDASGTYGMSGKLWGGSAHADRTGVLASFQGVAGGSWSSHDKVTIGALVNVDNSPANGMAVCLANTSEAKAYIKVKSDKKIEGFFKNTNGTSYILTSTRALHPGHNLITISYERNVGVKLAVNGEVMATATPSDHALFNATLALALGAQKLQGGAVSSKLTNGIVDDVWIAKGVLSDRDLWDVYTAYIIAAPLMLLDDVTVS
ncbi:MAG: hypothetical protein HY681_10970 [Chloroflexi bacterium]|nr:hypothetical protein [Chloroflexota bacterium]